ncbi:MAG TPA: DUF4157 domain-containing protein [Blastocatellia bacterium]|nr:DUF4157 domain-containing protein [Blastocatellia bacterium]
MHEVLNSPGQPLDTHTRAFMEPRFGHDFSQVRVHADTRAAESARTVNALAYTVGSDIAFGGGEYAPGTKGGRRLLAHELTHVVQQQGRTRLASKSFGLSTPFDPAEREAETAAENIVEGRQTPTITLAATGVQRDVGWAQRGRDPYGTAVDAGVEPSVQPGQPAQTPPTTPPTTPTLPTVVVGHFRNTGSTADSGENNCANCPRALGVHTTDFKNGMELRGDITGHTAGAQYDFKRTREGGIWKKVGGTWTQTHHDGPGENDDRTDNDEQLTPVNNHIYAEDIPGLGSNPAGGDAAATEAVLKGSFVEWVNVRVGTGAWTRSSNEFEWHSVSWVEKVGGTWQRKAGSNEIASGSSTVGTGNP